jgi:hypothetical protein
LKKAFDDLRVKSTMSDKERAFVRLVHDAIKARPTGSPADPSADEFMEGLLGLYAFEAIVFNDPTVMYCFGLVVLMGRMWMSSKSIYAAPANG